jgi:hypothetical protein
MSEAAAHAAAMQAFQDAMRQADDNNHGDYIYEYDSSVANSMMVETNGGSAGHLDFYNSEEIYGMVSTQAGFDSSQVELLNELMEYQQQSSGMHSADDTTAHELLHFLEQQQHEQIARERSVMMSEREARNRRPEKHYLTIANNGKISRSSHTKFN